MIQNRGESKPHLVKDPMLTEGKATVYTVFLDGEDIGRVRRYPDVKSGDIGAWDGGGRPASSRHEAVQLIVDRYRRKAERVKRAVEGQTFTSHMWDETTEYVVGPKCSANMGLWRCITHDRGFRNQLEKDGHVHSGEHVLVWMCSLHGPEVP